MQKRDSKTNLRDARLAGKLENSREEITAMVVETEDSERVIAAIGNFASYTGESITTLLYLSHSYNLKLLLLAYRKYLKNYL